VYPALGAADAQAEVDAIARDTFARSGSAAATGRADGMDISLDELDGVVDAERMEGVTTTGQDGVNSRWGEPQLVTKMSVQLSADRRVVDEATAGRFL